MISMHLSASITLILVGLGFFKFYLVQRDVKHSHAAMSVFDVAFMIAFAITALSCAQ